MVISLTWKNLLDRIFSVRSELILILPALHEEWVDAIKQHREKYDFLIKVCFDNSEKVIRKGYGSMDSIDMLRSLGADVRECPNLKIFLMVFDGLGIVAFMESRFLEGDPFGLNAIELNFDTTGQLVARFFPESLAAIKSDNPEPALAMPLDLGKLEKVKEKIAENPVEEADLKRKISTYNNYFQYAELRFEGANIKNTQITIPPESLKIKSEELKRRVKSKLDLFSKNDLANWDEISKLKNSVDEVRKKYLVSCSLKQGKSILRKSDRRDFKLAVEELQKMAGEITLMLRDRIQKVILDSIDMLHEQLTEVYTAEPPDSIRDLKDPETRARMIKQQVERVVNSIKIPDSKSLLEKLKISDDYYDLTYEDLFNEEFLKWFISAGLINKGVETELASFEKAFCIRK